MTGDESNERRFRTPDDPRWQVAMVIALACGLCFLLGWYLGNVSASHAEVGRAAPARDLTEAVPGEALLQMVAAAESVRGAVVGDDIFRHDEGHDLGARGVPDRAPDRAGVDASLSGQHAELPPNEGGFVPGTVALVLDAMASREEAARAADALTEAGLEARLLSRRINGESDWRVSLGSFTNPSAAEEARDSLISQYATVLAPFGTVSVLEL